MAPYRALMYLLAMVPLALLLVAGCLTPSAEGLGTHQQLGLPPCSMRVLYGVRCPGCGMTTSWSHFARLEWIRSWQANVGGFLLASLTVVFAPIAIRAGWSGAMPSATTQWWATLAVVAIAAISIAQWVARLAL